MKWKAPSEKTQDVVGVILSVPVVVISLPVLLPFVGLAWLLSKLPKTSDQWHPWFAWRPVPLDHWSERVGDRGRWAWRRWASAVLALTTGPLNIVFPEPPPMTDTPELIAVARGAMPKVEFHQHDWVPAFAAFVPGATTPEPDAKAFCVLNVAAFLESVDCGDLAPSELPYFIAETMMHEIIHALEQWAGVEFSEERVEALLARYRDHAADRSTIIGESGCDTDRNPEGEDPQGLRAEHESVGRQPSPETGRINHTGEGA